MSDKIMQGAFKSVYPGHPVVLACYIMDEYDSYEDAAKKGNQFPAALENHKVPGAG